METDNSDFTKSSSGRVPMLEADSPELDFMAFRDRMGTFLNSLSSNFNILVDVPYIPQSDTHMVTITGGISGEGFDYAIMTDGIEMNGSPSLGIAPKQTIEFSMYPNPANDNLVMTIQGTESHVVQIMTLNGQLVQSLSLDGGKHSVSTKDLANGLYYINSNYQSNKIILNK